MTHAYFAPFFELKLAILKLFEKPNDDRFAFFIGEFSNLDTNVLQVDQ